MLGNWVYTVIDPWPLLLISFFPVIPFRGQHVIKKKKEVQQSVKPLILPDNSYILRLAREHVLITTTEH